MGITWREENEFEAELKKATEAKSNFMLRDSIAAVADKISSKMYLVKTDTELGN